MKQNQLSEEEQLKKTMEEIHKLNEKVIGDPIKRAKSINLEASPVQAVDIKEPDPEQVSQPFEAALVTPLSNDAPLTLRQYDVVQVFDKESNHYGVFFQVGDVRGPKVHGYYLQPRGDKVYVTFNMDQLRLIGSSRVRSKAACSPQWVAQHSVSQHQ